MRSWQSLGDIVIEAHWFMGCAVRFDIAAAGCGLCNFTLI